MSDLMKFIRSTEYDYDDVIICLSYVSILDLLMSASQVVHHALSIVCAVSFTDDFTLLYSCMQFNDILWPQQWRWGYLGWLVVSALGETLLIRVRGSGGGCGGRGANPSIYVSYCGFVYEREQNER